MNASRNANAKRKHFLVKEDSYSTRSAPRRLATATTARLAASPPNDGVSPDAMLLELLEPEALEEEDVPEVVPEVVLLSEPTRALSLASDAKAADTELPLVQVDVGTPEPETNFTVAHYRRGQVSVVFPPSEFPIVQPQAKPTWYSSPSTASATTPTTPCWPTQLSGAATAGWQ